jgi:hypothetical protein
VGPAAGSKPKSCAPLPLTPGAGTGAPRFLALCLLELSFELDRGARYTQTEYAVETDPASDGLGSTGDAFGTGNPKGWVSEIVSLSS